MIEPYFIGLLEGDGSIQVNQWKQRILQFRIVIKLKYTPLNYTLCQRIQAHTQLFNLHVRHNYVILVQDDQQKLKKLCQLLDKYPFLSQKMQADYAFFKYCLQTKPTFSEYKFLKANKQLVPNFHPRKVPAQTLLKCAWIHWWIVGFVEAEGCFCVRTNGRISFGIGVKDESILMELIKQFFEMPNKIQHKANKMLVVEGSQRSMLQRVVTFFQTHQLVGEKKSSFEKFKFVFETPKSLSKDFGRCRG